MMLLLADNNISINRQHLLDRRQPDAHLLHSAGKSDFNVKVKKKEGIRKIIGKTCLYYTFKTTDF